MLFWKVHQKVQGKPLNFPLMNLTPTGHGDFKCKIRLWFPVMVSVGNSKGLHRVGKDSDFIDLIAFLSNRWNPLLSNFLETTLLVSTLPPFELNPEDSYQFTSGWDRLQPYHIFLVSAQLPLKGLEPLHISALVPKTSVSTNFTTEASYTSSGNRTHTHQSGRGF